MCLDVCSFYSPLYYLFLLLCERCQRDTIFAGKTFFYGQIVDLKIYMRIAYKHGKASDAN